MINDFIEYWVAAKLLVSGGNPYSPAELLAEQRALGWQQPEPLMMWNPPWTLSFTLPFGLFDYQAAQFAWFLSHTLIIFVGAQWLWKMYGGDPRKSRYAVICVLSFAPTYFVLLLGQIGPLMLLGLVAFLAAVKKKAWVLAGASLTIVAIKPHLLYLLWLASFLWAVKNAKWKLLVGFMLAGVSVASLPFLLDRQIYWQYSELLATGVVIRPLDWATPSLGTALAELFAIPGAWIRWLPSVGGIIWFLWYWSRHAATWNWLAELPVLILVSVVTASFAWTFDYVVLLPAAIQAAVWTSRSEDRLARALLIVTHIGLGGILLASKVFVVNDFWYFWLAPTLLLFYLTARAMVGSATTFPTDPTVRK
jgi:glycosyl transferase family 87